MVSWGSTWTGAWGWLPTWTSFFAHGASSLLSEDLEEEVSVLYLFTLINDVFSLSGILIVVCLLLLTMMFRVNSFMDKISLFWNKNQPNGLPSGASGKESVCQCRKRKGHEFDPWVRKIPWRRAWQPTSIFLPAESLGQRSLAGYSPLGGKELEATKTT